MPIPNFVASIPGRNSSANHELIFLASKVPPLGSKSYFIEVSASRRTSSPSILVYHWDKSDSLDILTDLGILNDVSEQSFSSYS